MARAKPCARIFSTCHSCALLPARGFIGGPLVRIAVSPALGGARRPDFAQTDSRVGGDRLVAIEIQAEEDRYGRPVRWGYRSTCRLGTGGIAGEMDHDLFPDGVAVQRACIPRERLKWTAREAAACGRTGKSRRDAGFQDSANGPTWRHRALSGHRSWSADRAASRADPAFVEVIVRLSGTAGRPKARTKSGAPADLQAADPQVGMIP